MSLKYPFFTFSSFNLSDSLEDSMHSIYLANAIESGFFLTIYLSLATYVLYQAKCKMPIDAYITLFIFLACSLSNLTCFILELYVEGDSAKRSLIEIPIIIASGLITAVLFWYTYQIKVVLLKILSDSPKAMFDRLYRVKLVLVSGYTLLLFSYILEVLEKIYLQNPNYRDQMTNTQKYTIVILNRLLTIVTEFSLIIFQSIYIITFLRIKYADGGFKAFKKSSKRTKFLTLWIFAILLLNSINTVGLNVMQTVIRIKQIKEQDVDLARLEKIWLIISTFLSDIVIFTNAAGFLYLFKQMSNSQNNKVGMSKSRNAKNNRNGLQQRGDIMDEVESMRSPLINGHDRFVKDSNSDISKNTAYMRQIMENKSSSDKTNTTLQNDNQYEFQNEVFDEQRTEKSSEMSKANKRFLFKQGSKKSSNSKQSKSGEYQASGENSGKRLLERQEKVNDMFIIGKNDDSLGVQPRGESNYIEGGADNQFQHYLMKLINNMSVRIEKKMSTRSDSTSTSKGKASPNFTREIQQHSNADTMANP